MPEEKSSTGKSRRWLVVMGGCLAAAVLVLAGLFWLTTSLLTTHTNAYWFIRGVEIEDPSKHAAAADAVGAGLLPDVDADFGTFSQDRLRRGTGSALVIRTQKVWRPSLTTDDAKYEAVTIIFPGDIPLDGISRIGTPSENSVVWALYAAGSPHYPNHACFGYASEGEIRTAPVAEGMIEVSATLVFDGVQMTGGALRSCEQRRIEITHEFAEVTLSEFQGRTE